MANKKSSSKKNADSKGNILVVVAHSDDQILGAGATLAKYFREGHKIYTIIMSYGELSYLHLVQEQHIRDIRRKESEDAEVIIGGNGTHFFDLRDGKLAKDVVRKNMDVKLREIIRKYKPIKIFTHSIDDIHPDHRTTQKTVLKAVDYLAEKENFQANVYSFEISQLWKIKNRNKPRLVVDVTKEFKYKIKALHAFKSQINIFSHTYEVNLLYLAVYIRGFLIGLRYGKGMAEIFYKIR